MANSPIPDNIRRYVIQCVPSVPYLEALLLMRERPTVFWQAEVLGRRLYLGEQDTARLLLKLHADGLVARDPGDRTAYRFAPVSPELEDIWAELAAVYARNLIEVSTLIHTRPAGKAKILADAFVWRKGK